MRRALRQALDAEAERRMADAYRRQPDNAEPEVIDPVDEVKRALGFSLDWPELKGV